MWPTELTVGRHADLKNELNAVLGVAHPSSPGAEPPSRLIFYYLYAI